MRGLRLVFRFAGGGFFARGTADLGGTYDVRLRAGSSCAGIGATRVLLAVGALLGLLLTGGSGGRTGTSSSTGACPCPFIHWASV